MSGEGGIPDIRTRLDAAEVAITGKEATGTAAAAVAAHVALPDPHTQYALESSLGTLATQNGTFSGTSSGTNTGDQTSVSGNAGTATTLQTGRTIAITGDLTWNSGSFNGSANVTAAGTLATVNSNVGTFGSGSLVPVITVNAKGLVTAVTTAAVSGGGGSGLTSPQVMARNLGC
jgi:uncharacterized protein (DUF2147 family)